MAIHDRGVRETDDMAQNRYNPDKLVHPSDAESWTHFDGIHRVKADEARNVRVALTTDGFNPYGMLAAPYTCISKVYYRFKSQHYALDYQETFNLSKIN